MDDDRGTNPQQPGGSDGASKPAVVAHATTAAASDVAATAASGAKDVAGEAASQAKVVAGEARRQIETVVGQTRQELSKQADDRAQQAAGGLRTLADQARALADGRPADAGPLTGVLDEARMRATALADRLESGGPQGVVDDVTAFARRRPIVFLAAAVGAGFVAGRLARAGRAAVSDDAEADDRAPTPSAELSPPLPAPILDAPLAGSGAVIP